MYVGSFPPTVVKDLQLNRRWAVVCLQCFPGNWPVESFWLLALKMFGFRCRMRVLCQQDVVVNENLHASEA